jgi:GT2 family glycosyltransferase
MKVVAITVNWNQPELTAIAVTSVLECVDHVIVVDNGSSPAERETLSGLEQLPTVELLWLSENLRYAGGVNRGFERALALCADAVLVMNNDARAEPGAVARLVDRLEQDPRIGIVMPAVVDIEGETILHTACTLNRRSGRVKWIDYGRPPGEIDPTPRPTDWASGEAFLVRTAVLRAHGGFDERYEAYLEDIDFSVRVGRDWRLEVVPAAVFRHVLGASGDAARGIFLRTRNQTLLLRLTLGRGRAASSLLGGRSALTMTARLVRRGRLAAALAALGGWLAASGRVFARTEGHRGAGT